MRLYLIEKYPKNSLRDHVRDKNKITLENLYKNSKGNDSLPLKGNQKNTIYINEPGLYQLIMKSKLKEAEKFQDWITDDLLPKIRKIRQEKYLQELQEKNKQIEANQQQLKAKDDQISSMQLRVMTLTNRIQNVEKFEKNGWVYFTTSKVYSANNQFRLGQTEELNARMQKYQVGRAKDDDLYYIFIHNCVNPRILENMLRNMLIHYRDTKTKDFYVMPWEILESYVKNAVKIYDRIVTRTNKLVSIN